MASSGGSSSSGSKSGLLIGGRVRKAFIRNCKDTIKYYFLSIVNSSCLTDHAHDLRIDGF